MGEFRRLWSAPIATVRQDTSGTAFAPVRGVGTAHAHSDSWWYMQSLNDLPASVRTAGDEGGTRQITGAGIKRAAGGRLKDFAGRGARLGRDLPVLLLVGVVSGAFVDPSHPVVAMLFG